MRGYRRPDDNDDREARLERALNTLLDQLDGDSSIDTEAVRADLADDGPSRPPSRWEREGYDSKETWLRDKRPDHAGQDR